MTERLDALTVRETNGKSYWTRIGVAFPAKQGPGWSIMLDAMPASTDGQYKIMLREPLPKDGDRSTSRQSVPARGAYDDLEDAPF